MEKDNVGEVNKDDVQRYYDYTRSFYRRFWHGNTNALHYGYHDDDAQDHERSLLKTIEMTANAGKITSSDRVADLGCGIGGTAFWIAKHRDAHVEGITISKRQYEKATELRSGLKLEHKVHFKIGDFFHTGYPSNDFDVALGVESLCYGQYDAYRLAQELYRILRKGGRLVITDGFLGTKTVTEEEKNNIKLFEDGFVIPKMITPNDFKVALIEVGFTDITFTDWTENIIPSAEKMYRLTRRWYIFTLCMVKLKLVPEFILKNNITGQVQLELFKKRALVYGCITAKK